jgi:hypothetical protein
MRKLQLALLVVAFAIDLGGCGGSSDSTANAGSQASCSLAPSGEVAAALGMTGLQDPTSVVREPTTSCSYALGSNAHKVIINFTLRTDAAGFAAAKKSFTAQGQPVNDLPGLGDAAFSSAGGTQVVPQNSLAVLKGTTSVFITSGATLAQEEALARQIIAKF